jgi:hypothetical protein
MGGSAVGALMPLVVTNWVHATYTQIPDWPAWFLAVYAAALVTRAFFYYAIWRWQVWGVYALLGLDIAINVLASSYMPMNISLTILVSLFWWTVLAILLYRRRDNFST